MGSLKARPRPITRHGLIGIAVALASASAAGIAVAFLPTRTALFALAVLSAALFFSFGRVALREKAQSLRVRLARERFSRYDRDVVSFPDPAPSSGFRGVCTT